MCQGYYIYTTVAGKTSFSAEEWAIKLIEALTDWGLHQRVISDRDSKFLSALWKVTFNSLCFDSLYSTAYHPHSDGQSHRANQPIEIALRHYLTTNQGADWERFEVRLRGILNNSKNSSIGKTPNELTYGKSVRNALSLTGPSVRTLILPQNGGKIRKRPLILRLSRIIVGLKVGEEGRIS